MIWKTPVRSAVYSYKLSYCPILVCKRFLKYLQLKQNTIQEVNNCHSKWVLPYVIKTPGIL